MSIEYISDKELFHIKTKNSSYIFRLRKGYELEHLYYGERINDTPSYDRPKQACEGIERVYVNGVLTALNGRHTGAAAGRVLRRGR